MFRSLENSWRLVKASWSVLKADKELIVFPIVSTIGVILVTIAFAVPMFFAGLFDKVADQGELGPAGIAVGFLFYVVMYTIIFFANTALVGAALIRLRGGDPTLRDGIEIAMSHIGQIVGYALIAATVGMLLRALRERGGLGGMIVAWLGDIAWNLATYLVVPVLVVEDIGPVDAIKRSASLLKRTWGEQVVGNFSIGLVFGLITLASAFVIGVPVIVLASATGSVAVVALGVLLVVGVIASISLVGTTLNGIYVAALYRYATEEVVVSEYFPPDVIQNAFRRE
jgi:hypothetical protein